jgi:hypothetical protein
MLYAGLDLSRKRLDADKMIRPRSATTITDAHGGTRSMPSEQATPAWLGQPFNSARSGRRPRKQADTPAQARTCRACERVRGSDPSLRQGGGPG